MVFSDPLYTVNGKMATALQFLKAYQGSLPRVYPDKMDAKDYAEFAEDYADYVCSYENSFQRRIDWLKPRVKEYLYMMTSHRLNDPKHYCLHCVLGESYVQALHLAEARIKTTYEDSLVLQ